MELQALEEHFRTRAMDASLKPGPRTVARQALQAQAIPDRQAHGGGAHGAGQRRGPASAGAAAIHARGALSLGHAAGADLRGAAPGLSALRRRHADHRLRDGGVHSAAHSRARGEVRSAFTAVALAVALALTGARAGRRIAASQRNGEGEGVNRLEVPRVALECLFSISSVPVWAALPRPRAMALGGAAQACRARTRTAEATSHRHRRGV